MELTSRYIDVCGNSITTGMCHATPTRSMQHFHTRQAKSGWMSSHIGEMIMLHKTWVLCMQKAKVVYQCVEMCSCRLYDR